MRSLSRSADSNHRLHTVTRITTSSFVVVAMCAAAGLVQPTEAVPTTHSAQAVTPAAKTVTIDGKAYPNPLSLDNGGSVTSAAVWQSTRRAELLADFRQDVFGQGLPAAPPESFKVTSTDFPTATRKTVKVTIIGTQGTGSFTLTLFVPKATAKPRGTFLMIDHRGAVGADPSQSSGYAPVATILKAGYAFASFKVADIAPDDNRTYRNKMINLFYPAGKDLPDNAGRAISAWAWGASRAMDYLQTDPAIDAALVAVIGHSRGGKAALWAGPRTPASLRPSGTTRGRPAPSSPGAATAESARRPSLPSTPRSPTGSRRRTRPSAAA